ncbi:MAG TPA: hypothetical protein VM681_01035 [Candidatus Thermoplasmatota archaeon]|nr:hypothetical protein [Candidatus Thermoplasmatota archaeon]
MRARYPLPFVPLLLSIVVPGVLLPAVFANFAALVAGGEAARAAVAPLAVAGFLAVVIAFAVYASARTFYAPMHAIAAHLESRGARYARAVASLAGPIVAFEFAHPSGTLRLQQVGFGHYALAREGQTAYVLAGPGSRAAVDAALEAWGLA